MRWSRLWRRLALVICVVSVGAAALVVALLDAMRDWNDNLFVALAVLGPTGLVVLLLAGGLWAVSGLKSRRRQRPAAQWLAATAAEPAPAFDKPKPNFRPRWITVVPRPPFPGPVTAGSGA
jgi:peptidoglycan/LPS O-acetylase OafA/YrhL